MTSKPVAQVLLTIETALQDELITDSGLKLYIDPTYNKNFTATVVATIAALPLNPKPEYKKLLENLSVGDVVAMSYMVVADFEFESDAPRFMPVTEPNDHYREYINGKGYWVKVYALPKKVGIGSHTWVGVYQDNRMNIIDGKQGTQSEVETWLAQFPLGKTDIYRFKNLFQFEGKEYWSCDPDLIFAKKVKGHWKAVGDRIICKPIRDKVPEQFLIDAHKGQLVEIQYEDRGRVITGGKEKGIKKDDIVSFDHKYLEKYTFDNKDYFLINENFVEGKWN